MKHTKISPAEELIAQFQHVYSQLNSTNCQSGLIDQIYHEHMVFKDSFHEIEGSQAFKDYCSSLYENLQQCDFVFHKHWIGKQDAMLTWTMHYAHPKLNRGRLISVEGATQLCFDDKIFSHQDYFDGGNLLYEHIPLLGTIIGQLKKRMMS